MGELKYLQKHLDPVIRKCGFILLACPLGCGEHIRGFAMKDHILSGCSNRMYVCEHCGYYNKCDVVTEQHYPLCEMFPVECPNTCSVENLKRLELVSHLEQCPLQVIRCPFTSAGCTVQLPRREIEEHEDKAVRQHLRMMMSMMQLKPKPEEPPAAVSVTTDQLEYLVNSPPVEFIIAEFTEKKECNAEWMSPPFCTHPQGCKFCLVVHPNGYISRNTHMSVGVFLLEGDHANFACPLEMAFVVDILNWREDKENCYEIIDFNSANNLVTKNGIKRSPILTQFIPHSSLSYNSTTNTEYLQNDCVRLRVSKVILYSTALFNKTPSWQNPHNGYQSLHEFTLTEFSKRKQFSNIHFSSPFYNYRYKFFLQVDSKGIDDSRYVSVYLTLMAGEYDDQLVWPFVGGFSIKLLNWREDKGHYSRTFLVRASDGFVKVTEGAYGQEIGKQFIAHSSLAYDPTRNIEYLQEDCLRFRVIMKYLQEDCLRFRVIMKKTNKSA